MKIFPQTALILITIQVSSNYAIYQDQFGLFEWRLNNFGDIQYAAKSENTIFLSDGQTMGLLNSSGQYKSGKIIKNSDIYYDVALNDRIIVLSPNQNTVEVHNVSSTSFQTNWHLGDVKVKKISFTDGTLGFIDAEGKIGTLKSGVVNFVKTSYKDLVGISTHDTNFQVLYKDDNRYCVKEYNKELKDMDMDKNCGENQETLKNSKITPILNGFLIEHKDEYEIITPKGNKLFDKRQYDYVFEVNGGNFVLAKGKKYYKMYEITKHIKENFIAAVNAYNCDHSRNIAKNGINELGIVCKSLKESDDTKTVQKFLHGQHSLITEDFKVIKTEGLTNISNIWVFSWRPNNDPEFLIKNDDLSLHYYSGKFDTPFWVKEEGLSFITDSQILKFQSNNQSLRNWTQYESMIKDRNLDLFSIVNATQYRFVKNQDYIRDFVTFIIQTAQQLNFNELVQKIKGQNLYTKVDADFLDRYSIHKRIAVLCKTNIIYGLDSIDGSVAWKYYQPKKSKVIGFALKNEYNPSTFYQEVKVTYLEDNLEYVLLLEGDKGKVTTLYEGPILQGKNVEILNEETNIDIKKNVMSASNKNLSFFKLNEKEKNIKGYNYINQEFIEVWSIDFSPEEKIIDYSYHLKGDPSLYKKTNSGFLQHIPDENKVIYKIVDTSNVSILTSQPSDKDKKNFDLKLYVLNVRSGRILQTFKQEDVDFTHTVCLNYDDNGIFITYFNKISKIYNLWVVELFREDIESSFVTMLNKFWFHTAKDRPVDYYDENGNFILLDQKYGLPFGIKKIKPVQTKAGLTRRNLIAITTDNQVYSIDRKQASTRRPNTDLSQAPPTKKFSDIDQEISYTSTYLPKYEFMIQFSPNSVLNANWPMNNLSDLKISETDFESTAVVFAYGKDLFWCKVNPDKGFDMLNDDFNYWMLLAIVVGVTIAAIVLKQMAKSKEAMRRFTDQ